MKNANLNKKSELLYIFVIYKNECNSLLSEKEGKNTK